MTREIEVKAKAWDILKGEIDNAQNRLFSNEKLITEMNFAMSYAFKTATMEYELDEKSMS